MDLNSKVSKEIVEKAYEVLQLAQKGGKIKKGVNEVTKTIERGTAKVVFVAQDTNPKEIVMHLPPLCEEKEIPLVPVPSKEKLGEAANLGVSSAAVSITNEGDAKQAIKELVSKLQSKND